MADPEALFAANHNRLFRYFCRAVGRAETARDLTQEVFLRVSRTAITLETVRARTDPPQEDGYHSARWFRSTVHMRPNEIVDVALPQTDEYAGALANRVFSIRIQAKQIR
jgi:hypothetical protein